MLVQIRNSIYWRWKHHFLVIDRGRKWKKDAIAEEEYSKKTPLIWGSRHTQGGREREREMKRCLGLEKGPSNTWLGRLQAMFGRRGGGALSDFETNALSTPSFSFSRSVEEAVSFRVERTPPNQHTLGGRKGFSGFYLLIHDRTASEQKIAIPNNVQWAIQSSPTPTMSVDGHPMRVVFLF